jgi:ATP-dependent RNA helicase SUPV3L1/SUV3
MNISIPAVQRQKFERSKGVTVVLGPTNTGKTHYAIERMLSYPSGIIGLPLRLLAREVYNRVVEKVGTEAVALVTGEEKIKPKNPRYWVSTVEAMPRDLNVAFVAVDEIQLATDLDRGHIFTDRLLNRRGTDETLLIGASTMERAIRELLPGAPVLSRPRLSKLTFAGDKKIARLPRRSAIVAFSAEEVYAIAEWIRRQRGGAAVVLGALSPRTRNAQVEMFQSGDIDYIVATDAIGMGLNLDVDHIAFASDRKFDGWHYRRLIPAEFGQIAGRAGRHMRDGTFGTTGRCPPFDPELVEALEDHRFDPVRMLQWRNTDLDFSSLAALQASLDILPNEPGLTRAPIAQDQLVLEIAARDENVIRAAKTKADIARLWETCQIPDYRKLSPSAHAELVLSIFHFIVRAGHVPEDWFSRHVSALDRVDGDLDTLSARIAQVRTWTFIANRTDWLGDPEHWQSVTRRVEDILSDALHERLAQRFVDRRTSVLMRRLRENAMLEAEVTSSGDVMVEGQHVGHLNGFRFTLDPQAGGEAARTLNAAAQKALASEIEGRATRVHEAVDEAFVLANDGLIRWLGEPVAKLIDGAHVLEPRTRVLADEQLTGASLEKVQRRLDLWTAQHIKKLLGPLAELEKAEGIEGIARGVAFQIAEALGILERSRVAEEVKGLSQDARAALRKFGVRFGAFHLYLPQLIKPAPRALAAQLWALRHGGVEEIKGLDEVPHLASSGRTSFVADKDVPKGLYRAAGFRVCGDRAVRVDILERLADLIRPAVSYRPGLTVGEPPAGAADGDGFVVTVNMTSLAGCSGESFASILRSLGYQSEQRKGPAITVPLIAKAATEPLRPADTTGGEAPAASEETADHPETEAASIDANPAEEPKSETTPEPEAPSAPEPAAEAVGEPVAAEPLEAVAPEGETTPAPTEATPAAPEAEAEPQLIEVWHPHRQHHQKHAGARNQHHQRNRAPRQGEAVKTPEMAEAGVDVTAKPEGQDEHKRGDHKRDNRHRNDNRRHPPRRDSATPNQDPAAATAGAEQTAKPNADNRRGGKPGFRGGRQDDHRQDREHRQGREHRQDRPEHANKPAPRREREPDPNSPFAKLLELKARLENNADSK